MSDYEAPDITIRMERIANNMLNQARHDLTMGNTARAYELDNQATMLMVAAAEIRSLRHSLKATQTAIYVPFTPKSAKPANP